MDKVVADSSDFVDLRRRDLLRFLKRLCKHRILGQSEEFSDFIKSPKFYHSASSSGITKSLKSIRKQGKDTLGFKD